MKKLILSLLAFVSVIILAACNGNGVAGDSFDPKVEQEKATEVINGVLTSFEDQEKLAEAKTSDEANQIAWKKIKEKNIKAISSDLSEEGQKRLLYVLTVNKAETIDNGETKSNLHFSQEAKIKNVNLNETEQEFVFDMERLGVDHTLITLKKEEDSWRIGTVKDPE